NVDYWFCDGSLMCVLTNLRRKKNISRASFDLTSIAQDVFNFSEKNSLNIAFIGAKPDEINTSIKNINSMYPRLNIAFYSHGFLSNQEKKNIVDQLNNLDIDILVVGMGTPKQEKEAIYYQNNVSNLKLVLTCGGFLTQTAIKPDYYHPLIKKTGLRWLQRAIMHSHVRKRLLVNYPLFIIRYLFNK
ncbi:TPA: WecB/TagA/CpsF family glycosyltransferase, partial [Morganella morganii]|nr:WecB/TagA/CpsF family glycosyltransferase [Morganella morganii]